MAIVRDLGNPQSVTEPHIDRNPDAPFKRRVIMVVGGTPVAKGRSVVVNATAAGNAVFQYQDGSTFTVPIGVGAQSFPEAITRVVSTTATAVFTNEY